MNRTRNKQPLPWYKTLENYYERPEWELYDLKYDPEEKNNIASKSSVKVIKIKIFFIYFNCNKSTLNYFSEYIQ